MARTAVPFRVPSGLGSPTRTSGVAYTGAITLDAYAQGATAPVIGFLHGGGWLVGDKASGSSLTVAQRFAGVGFTVFSANYSLDPADPQTPITEALAFVTWMRANAATYNGDPRLIVLMGDSAGAHLALMAGITGVAGGSRPDAVLAWSPPCHLGTTTGDMATFCEAYMNTPYSGGGVALWDAKSPTVMVADALYANNMPPYRIVGSSAETLLAQAQYDNFHTAALAANTSLINGTTAVKRIFTGAIHGDFSHDSQYMTGADDVQAAVAWIRSLSVPARPPYEPKPTTARALASARPLASARALVA